MIFPSYKEAATHVSQAVMDQHASTFVKCGDLACQHDSFRKSLDTSQILGAAAFQEKPAKGSNKKNKKKAPVTDDAKSDAVQYVVALSDSILFPEGGGQPADHGTINTGKEDLQVVNVQNVQNVCLAICLAQNQDKDDDILQHLNTNPTAVQALDWDRRFDLMTQHSAQHLISAVAMNLFEMPTHSFSLQATGASYIDFTVTDEQPVDHYQERLSSIESAANDYIRQNLPMTPTWLDVDDPLFATKVRSRLLPKGLTGKIRLVEIGSDVDCNTCCGTHVPTLGELQAIQFFKTEKVKGSTLRVHFAAARRLLEVSAQNFQRQQQLTQLVGCPADLQVERVSTMLDDKKSAQSKIKALQQALCECLAKEIAVELNQAKAVVRELDPETSDLGVLCSAVQEKMQDNKGTLLLLVSGTAFLLTGDADLVDKVGKPVAEALQARGGGRKGKFQGKMAQAPSKESLLEAEKLLQEATKE